MHGRDIVDPYRWLEGTPLDAERPGIATPEVAAWTDAQNAYTRSVLDGLDIRPKVEASLAPLMQVAAVSLPDVRGRRHFFSRREGTEDQAVIYWRDGHDAADQLLIDPHAIDGTGLTTVEWVSASPDGTLAAYGTYRAGDENTTLRVMSVGDGARLPVEITGKTESAQWLPDGSGFVYRHLRDPDDPYSAQVRFHRLGSDPGLDPVLFRQLTAAEDPALSTTWGPFGTLSRDGRWLLLGYWQDTVSTDLWLLDFDLFLRTGRAVRVEVSTGLPGLASGTVIGGTVYLHTTKGAPRGRVVAADVSDPGFTSWRDVVPERSDAVIESIAFGLDCLAVTYLRRASSVVEVFDRSGRPRGAVRQPGIGTVVVACEPDRPEAFLQFTSFNHPTTIFRVDLRHPEAEGAVWAKPAVPVDSSDIRVEQVSYASKDGTPISMFLVRRHGLDRTGDAPTLLYGYGGFNINLTPAFSPTLVPWLQAGGIYAVPNLRGGGEYGDDWHEAGMLDRKQRVFDDVIAAAEWLVAEGHTSPRRLAISGGSNGGLLVGAAITQRPDLFRAAVIAVPLLDMLRYQHFLMARYWVPEYGSAEDPSQFAYLAAYSPYHRVENGTTYPAVLLTAGEHDTRVHALHARKMAAALQHATSSDLAAQPVLLWVDREAGHGQGKPLTLRLRDAVDQRVFLLWQLGMTPESPLLS